MDLELFWTAGASLADLGFSGGDLATDHDLKTAILLSLFTDQRAKDDDQLPDQMQGKRGWWGDALGVNGVNRKIGSRLWLLAREKQVQEVVNRAQEYAQEALQWLVDDGVVLSVAVSSAIVAPSTLGLSIAVQRNQQTPARYRFEFAWNNLSQVSA